MSLKAFFISLLCLFITTSAISVSVDNPTTLDDSFEKLFKVVLVNYTPIPILLRLRYGPIGNDLKNPLPPLGFIRSVDENSILEANDQVVKIKSGQAVSFETKITELPYRIRIWRENYIPDLDLDTNGKPVKTSKKNTVNSLTAIKIAKFEFDNETLKHTFAITQTREGKITINEINNHPLCDFINCGKGHYVNGNTI